MQEQYAIFGLGTPEVVLIVILALVLFGGKKIPELMRGIGQGVREFNSAKANIKTEIEEGMKNKPATTNETKEKEEEKA
ncbi:MAG: twin-arginine translocase TatA/TatE family subunit [Bacteroidetes bacterium]|nr:twin-arginine translocase TatA/TatE family subunit [Bacteroidota bacterium]